MKSIRCEAVQLTLLLLLLLLTGCGSTTVHKRLDGPVVSAERIYEILASVEGSADPDETDADRWLGPWEMVGPMPAEHGITPLTSAEPWMQPFMNAAANRGATRSEQTTCYARQRAAISASAGDRRIADELNAFLASRCGLPDRPDHVIWIYLPGGTTSDKVTLRNDEVSKKIERLSLNASVHWGAAFWQGPKESVIVLASVEPTYRFDSFPIRSGIDGEVVISGTALHPVREVIAYSDTGPLSSASCRRDTTRLVPNFRMTCRVGRDLPFAQISVLELVEGQSSFLDVQRLLVAPAGTGTRFALPEVGEPSDPSLPIELQTVELLNRVRTQAGLTPVVLHEPSQVFAGGFALFSAKVVPTDPRWPELFSGLTAGWLISEPHLAASRNGLILSRKEGVSGMVAAMLVNPRMREAALDPLTRFVSLGIHDGVHTRTLESLWFNGVDEGANTKPDAERFIARVNEMRAVQGLAPVKRAGKHQREALEEAAEEVRGGMHPTTALEEARSRLRRWTRDPVWTYIYSFDELSTIDLDADFFNAKNIVLDVEVVPYRELPSPLTHYRALMLFRVQQ